MPLYDYACGRGHEFEAVNTIDDRAKQICPQCGSAAKQIIKPGHGGTVLFKPGYWRDLDYHPVYVDSPQQLRRELDNRGSTAPYLENGPWKTSPEATKEELKNERRNR